MFFTKHAYQPLNQHLSKNGRLDLKNLGRVLRKQMQLPHSLPTNNDFLILPNNHEDRLCKDHFVYHVIYRNEITFTVIVKKHDVEDGPTVLAAYDFKKVK